METILIFPLIQAKIIKLSSVILSCDSTCYIFILVRLRDRNTVPLLGSFSPSSSIHQLTSSIFHCLSITMVIVVKVSKLMPCDERIIFKNQCALGSIPKLDCGTPDMKVNYIMRVQSIWL